jgi:hypothetical protein
MEMKLYTQNSQNFLIALIIFFSAIQTSFSQTGNVREKVFINLNTHDLLVGETLQYATSSISYTNNKISHLSKYVYVELIGENGVIFQRKHQLIEGKAYGEFFISSDIETGSYFLVAYTRWMQNFNNVSKSEISIINPYKDYINPQITNEKLNVEFGTTSGQIVANVTNKVILKASKGGKPVAIEARVINQDGTIEEVSTNNQGFGWFEISPNENESLQLLVEGQGDGFNFFDLPKPVLNGIGLNITHEERVMLLQPVGAVQNGTLTIYHQGKSIVERKIETRSPVRVQRDDLPKDVFTVVFKDASGREQFRSPLFNVEVSEKRINNAFTTQSLATIDQYLPAGNYSISIRKAFSSEKPRQHAVADQNYVANGLQELQNTSVFSAIEEQPLPEKVGLLPEYRYQLLEGTLKTEDPAISVQNKHVILSLTGENDMNMAIARTDEKGRFVLEYETVHRGSMAPAHLTIPDFEQSYTVEIEENFINNHILNFEPLIIDSTYYSDIKERSIISQIENAYFTPITDTIAVKNNVPPTIPYFNAHYEFDDYTRFKTLKEHFAEYIQVAGVRERKGEKRFVLYSLDEGFTFETDPMVFLDGVPVPMNEILEFSPYRIKSVDIFNRRYFLGSLVADGVLSFQTLEGNLGGFQFDRNHMVFELLSPQPAPKTSYNSFDSEDRVPDSRIQLLWLPDYKVNKSETVPIQFQTSGIVGEYRMYIEGFTTNGEPVSIINTFTVNELDNE